MLQIAEFDAGHWRNVVRAAPSAAMKSSAGLCWSAPVNYRPMA